MEILLGRLNKAVGASGRIARVILVDDGSTVQDGATSGALGCRSAFCGGGGCCPLLTPSATPARAPETKIEKGVSIPFGRRSIPLTVTIHAVVATRTRSRRERIFRTEEAARKTGNSNSPRAPTNPRIPRVPRMMIQ